MTKTKTKTKSKKINAEAIAATKFFSENDARVEVVRLREYETPVYVFADKKGQQHSVAGEEFIVKEPTYDEVFNRIDTTLTDLVKEFKRTYGEQHVPYARITHRQSRLIELVDDAYIAVVSIVVMFDPRLLEEETAPEPSSTDGEAEVMNGNDLYPGWGDTTQAEDIEPVSVTPPPSAPAEKPAENNEPTMLSFGQALVALQHGANITRLGWTGAAFIYLCTNWVVSPEQAADVKADSIAIAPTFVRNVNGVNYVGWVPNAEEMLSKDWMIIK